MGDIDFIRDSASSARRWRDMALEKMGEAGFDDLSYRPRTGMSSLGWLLAHQAAVYDFTLNVLILQRQAANPKLFNKHVPGTTGDWVGISLEEIHEYYDSMEKQFLDWADQASQDDMTLVIQESEAPPFFVGMTTREVITYMFAHLNYHNGHISSLVRDWLVWGTSE